MTEQLVVFNNDMRAHLYYWAENFDSVKRVTIIAPGLPNFPDKQFFKNLPHELQNEAYLLIYYPGYWFSSGEFTLDNCTYAIQDSYFAVRNGMLRDAITSQHIKPHEGEINLLAYSFGANPLMGAIATMQDDDLSEINRIDYVAPLCAIHQDDMKDINKDVLSKFYKYNVSFTDFLTKCYPELIRMKDNTEWDNYFTGDHPNSKLPNNNNAIAKSRIHIGLEDKLLSLETLMPLTHLFDQDKILEYPGIGHDKSLIIKALIRG